MSEFRKIGSSIEFESINEFFDSLPAGHIARFLPDVYFDFDSYEWTDPVWGRAEIDESWGSIDRSEDDPNYPAMFRQLLLHPAITRMICIEQLTLPKQYATIENAAQFSRWEHITGSAILVKQLVDKWNLQHSDDAVDNRQKVIYILRTMLSDVGHTVGSHVGDWIMNDADEKEHDEQLLEYIQDNGIADIIEQYGIQLREVILTEVDEDDFVERSSPYLCIDRVDYATREIHRTNRYFDDPSKKFTIDDFELIKDENDVLQLVMTDPSRALLFAKTYELLPKEDWSEPMQRLQTSLYTDMLKLMLVSIGNGISPTTVSRIELPPYGYDDSTWMYESERHPRDILMYAESVIADTMTRIHSVQSMNIEREQGADEIMKTILDYDYIMRSLSQLASSYNNNERQAEVAEFTRSVDAHEINPNAQVQDRSLLESAQKIEIQEGRAIGFHFMALNETSTEYTIDLPQRKKRSIDPVMNIDGRICRLSEYSDGEYTPNNDAYAPMMAEIVSNDPEIMKSLKRMPILLERHWAELLERPRMPAEQMRIVQKIALKGLVAVGDYWQNTQSGYVGDLHKKADMERFFDYVRSTRESEGETATIVDVAKEG